MGGILSAEVALQRPFPPIEGKPLRHRLLGTINFDTPFLGMHPGVVGAGLSSLFRPADPPGVKSPPSSTSGMTTPSMSSQASVHSSSQGYTSSISGSSQMSLVQSITSPGANSPNDPFFNAPFPNDVRLPERKGISSLLHFINKHSDGLTGATKEYFMSHIEFGGVMADYTGLKIRYENVRKLEDVDDITRRPGQTGSQNMRVRFVNYYTASTGRPKPPKTPPTPSVEGPEVEAENLQNLRDDLNGLGLNAIEHDSSQQAPTILVEEHGDGTVTPRPLEENNQTSDMSPIKAQIQNLGENSGVQDEPNELPAMQHIDSMPIEDDDSAEPVAPAPSSDEVSPPPAPEVKPKSSEPPLPPIPEVPTEPEPIDLTLYTDKDSRKIAEKEFKRVTKVYQQAIKDRESAIKDRRKLVEKREKKARQEQEKLQKAEEKQRLKEEKDEQKRLATVNPPEKPPKERKASVTSTSSVIDDKPKRDKKFCILPPKYGGERDKCWVRVYMEGVDEVGAHCGLFFPGPQYESLVGDVGARIGKWVEEDATRRAILEAEMLD